MHSTQQTNKIVRHVSVSFRDIIKLPANVNKESESTMATPEKNNFTSNCQSRYKILYLSINALMKENRNSDKYTYYENRRQKLKELSSGYQLRRESLSYIKLS
ncbi:hypothetical protein SteCoe_27944 [Stentor coeruleus]|uniref:Uncharacterized protein n=1 Tax=Stentor coeruleus TaxID=5963 RepID=A0A1R2B9F0_9CILI|nr:hypothetical protein SteCoe_27944 [Stentor coeruleus]